MTWIVLLLVGGIAGGVFAYMRFRDRPVYVGEAVGERIPAGKTVAVVVPWDTIGVDLQTRQAVIEYFTRRPGKMINPLVEMQIGTLPTGLEVRFNPGRDAELIRVDPLQIKDLQKLVLEKGKAWDATREAELKAGAIRLCQAAAAAHLNDTAVAGLTEYGRPVGINSMVHGLGYECEAIYDQTRYPCVMEDGDGSLYFLVPDKIRVFQVQQRSDQGHPPVLPAEFSLRVTVPPYPIEAPHVEPEPGEVPDPATDRKPQVAPTKRPPQADAKAMDKP